MIQGSSLFFKMEIDHENLKILLVTGSHCVQNEHIIIDYDDTSTMCFMHKLFTELDEIPSNNIILSFSDPPEYSYIDNESFRIFQKLDCKFHVDFDGKQYSFPSSKIPRMYDSYETQVNQILLSNDNKDKIQKPIDLIIFFKDHGNHLNFGREGRAYAELLIKLNAHIPPERRKRTIIFVDSCNSSALFKSYEYCNFFYELFPDLSITTNNILQKFFQALVYIVEKNEKEADHDISIDDVIKLIQEEIKQIEDQEVACRLTEFDQKRLAIFIDDYHQLLKKKYSPIDLKSFFSSPVWIFCSSPYEVMTFAYPFRKFIQEKPLSTFPSDATGNGEENQSTSESQNDNQDVKSVDDDGLIVVDCVESPETIETQKKIEASIQSTFQKQKSQKPLDVKTLKINIREENAYYVQPSSFFTNAVISSLFPQKDAIPTTPAESTIDKGKMSPYNYNKFINSIIENMKSQVDSFRKSNYYMELSHNISELRQELSKITPDYESVKTYKVDEKKEELERKENELKSTNSLRSDCAEKIVALFSKGVNGIPSNEIQEYNLLSSQIDKLTEEIHELRNKIKSTEDILARYNECDKNFKSIQQEHEDMEKFFDFWTKGNYQSVFFSLNTKDVSFPDFSQLQKKPFSNIPWKKENITFNDYVYFDHTYNPLFKVSDPSLSGSNYEYLLGQYAFTCAFMELTTKTLEAHNLKRMKFIDIYDCELSEDSFHFYSGIVGRFACQINGYFSVYIGAFMQEIRYYYDHFQPFNRPLFRSLLVQCGIDIDNKWRQEYEDRNRKATKK